MSDCARPQYAQKLNQECVMVHISPSSPRRPVAPCGSVEYRMIAGVPSGSTLAATAPADVPTIG